MLAVLAILAAGAGARRVPAAWGGVNHISVSRVAEDYLDRRTVAVIDFLLAGEDFVESTTWADSNRSGPYEWTSTFHYFNLPDDVCFFDLDAHCSPTGCQASAVHNFTAQLVARDRSQNLTESFKFNTHFIQDALCPMHGGRESDRGGNDVALTFCGSSTNLHSLWDSGLTGEWLRRNDRSIEAEMRRRLDGEYADQIDRWLDCGLGTDTVICPEVWSDQTAQWACFAYEGIESGDAICEEYLDRVEDVLFESLCRSAIYTAASLNEIFGGTAWDDVAGALLA